ncbi:MAG: D-alanyl-D-alanine carboxypeptidase/D-alanyl-D-alanine-endopeptidase [Gammaproteobacteria bacterium]|jgi:D-alanyl-D-alanine carboxypeptidase/D-alanyl-D-alanine-endopeptidase (penicillin-binding protein 4)|nr:D-alanyl-D-alanine carboxypeptidase/D-alanyl-D-alanine-endopeptidase [Gammaproteobacteria bacterium]
MARRFLWPAALCCALLTVVATRASAEPAAWSPLPERLRQILTAHDAPADGVGVYVHAVGAPAPLVSVNAAAPFNPASTIKLLTTWVGLEELGPAWRWPTEVYIRGDLQRGVLDGDLIIKGYGDPYLTTERLWLLLRELRLRGLRTIQGDLVIDNGYFADEYGDPADFDGDGLRAYNVFPDAFLVNFQALRLFFEPDPARNGVRVFADPMPANLSVENRLQLRSGRCGGFRNGVALNLEGGAARDRLIVSGRYGGNCELYSMTRSVLTGPTFAYGVFRSLWEELGGELQGNLRVAPGLIGADSADTQPALFARVESPALAEVIASINKYSNNVMSRHLFLTLAAETFEPPATLAKARRAAVLALQRRGLDFPELRLDNGAGLSRNTRIAAQSLGGLLLTASESPWMPEFVSSLSLAGLDGTLRKRFRGDATTGRMHLKTGRLQDVFATAGYVHARSGRDYVVVILQNYPDADRGPGEEAQAALLRWVYEQ